MSKRKLTIPLSIPLFLAFVLAGTYVARWSVLRGQMVNSLEIGDEGTVLKLLNGFPCPTGARSRKGLSILGWAAEAGNVEIVRVCIRKGLDVNAVEQGETALHRAVARRSVEMVTLLLDSGADVNSWTVRAPPRAFAPFSSQFLEKRPAGSGQAVFISTPSTYDTPLHYAAATDETGEMVDLLLRRGADVNARNASGETPVHTAAVVAGEAVVRRLLAGGADGLARDASGYTPFDSAWHPPVAALLLVPGIDPKATDSSGRTPLHLAALKGLDDVAERLIAMGADVNAKDTDGDTPLKTAKDCPFLPAGVANPVIDVLLRHGAKE